MAWTTPGTATAGEVLTAGFWNEQVRDNLDSVLSYGKVAHFRDEKASGTNGGTFTSGAWQTRTLNTTKRNVITGCSLASNQITLAAGTYFIIARAQGYRVDEHQLRFYNTTDTATTIVGSQMYSVSTADYANQDAWVFGFFSIASQKVFEIQHRCTTTKTTNGLGLQASFGEVNVFAEIIVWKVS